MQKWPDHLVLIMELGNAAYATGDLQLAANSLRHVAGMHPRSAAAYDNLANVLLAQKQIPQANVVSKQSLLLPGEDENFKSQIAHTLVEIGSRRNDQLGC